MFREDVCTIKRAYIENIQGEEVYGDPVIVYDNVPCHLSVQSISPVNQTQSTATVLLDYTLFVDTNLGVTINPNDYIYITTSQGQKYELRAGESHKYRLTTQTHCEKVKVS